MTDKFTKRIQLALDKACPIRQRKIKCNGNAWFCESLEELRKEAEASHSKAIKTKTEWHRDDHTKKKNKYKYACRKAKKNSWNEFVSSRDTAKKTSKYLGILSGQSKSKINTFKKPDGTNTDPGRETAELLLETHFP